MLGSTLPVLVVCLAAQVGKTQTSGDGRQYDLLTPSTFNFQVKVHLGALESGGVEQVTAFTTGIVTDTQSSTSGASMTESEALFSLLISSCSVTAKVQLMSGNSVDGYLPLPVTSRGTNFVVSSWNSGTSFIAIRCGPDSATVTISVPSGAAPSTSVVVGATTLTPGDSTSLQVSSNQELLITSTGFAVDGVQVSSTQPVSVWAGNKDGNVLGIGQTTTLVEMFPPSDYFSTDYIVQIPTGVVLCMLKVVALSSSTSITQRATGNSLTSNTLAASGDVWTISQIGTVHLVATSPVMVIQYIPASGGSNYASMTLIHPSNNWLSSYLVWALDSPSTGTQIACVAILTAQVSQLTATRLSDGADMTSLMTFASFTGSDYSTATLSLSDSSVIQLKTADGSTTFQVVQYGGISGTDGAYAFPSGAVVTCDDVTTTSSSTPTSSGSSRVVSFLPNPALFTILALCAICILGAIAEAVRRWKLRKNSKSYADDHPKNCGKETPMSEEFQNTASAREKYPMDDFSSPPHFRSKPPADSSYIQVKPYIPR